MGVKGFGERLSESRRLKGVRDRADYRPADLARDMETTGATVSRWENGGAVPDVETIARLAKLLAVDPGWLAFGTASQQAPARPPLEDKEEAAPREPPAPPARQRRRKGA